MSDTTPSQPLSDDELKQAIWDVIPRNLSGDVNDLLDLFHTQAALRDREARQETANAAIELVNQYSIHIPKGRPKGTLARLNLNKRLAKLSQPQGGQTNAY
jgi:hypothetical protein